MKTRIELNDALKEALGSGNVYFQPPENLKIQYPCVIYELTSEKTGHANDRRYSVDKGYQITVIDKNPDSDIPDRIAYLPYCSFSRHFVSDNLHHFVYNLYL